MTHTNLRKRKTSPENVSVRNTKGVELGIHQHPIFSVQPKI